MVTEQGKRAPIRVYADHTVISDSTEVLPKLNLKQDFGSDASLNKCTIMKTCCKKDTKKLQHSKHKIKDSEKF